MKKLLIVIGGLAALGIAYWLASPLFITRRADEKLEDITTSTGTRLARAGTHSRERWY